MFLVSEHTALKMAITSNYVLQKTLSTFANLNLRQKYKKKTENLPHFRLDNFSARFFGSNDFNPELRRSQ